MRAFIWMLLPALAVAHCAPEPRYAEPERCMEHDCSDQRPGYDAGAAASGASVDAAGDYVRGGP